MNVFGTFKHHDIQLVMTHTEASIAKFAHHNFLGRRKKNENKTCWIIVENRESGLNVTRKMVQLAKGTAEPVEIYFDNLPTQPGFNEHNGNAVFVLSQPNHIPTVQTTMQGITADLRKQNLSQVEKDFVDVTRPGGLMGKHFDEKYILNSAKDNVGGKLPDLMIIDQKYPMWVELKPFANTAEIFYTDNVAQKQVPENPRGESGQFQPAD